MIMTPTEPATAVADSNKVTTIACYGGTASATVFAYGGVHPYTYAWSGGNSSNSSEQALQQVLMSVQSAIQTDAE